MPAKPHFKSQILDSRQFQGGKLPLSFSAEEMDLLLELAAPIDQRLRKQLLYEVAAELEAAAEQTRVGPGPGLHRVGRVLQRRL